MVSTDSPALVELLQLAVQSRLALVHTSIPARVLEYDRARQVADVQVAIRSYRRDPTTDELISYLPEPIPAVPVIWPSGSGGSLTFDLTEGDPGWLLVSERSLDEWKQTGQRDSTPADVRRFDLTDAAFLPGGRAIPQALGPGGYAAAAAVLAGADVRLGSSAATQVVALGPKVDLDLQQLAAVFTNWVPVAQDGGAALKALLTSLIGGGWPASTGASKVKAE